MSIFAPIKAAVATGRERLTGSFSGAFLLSWVAWNWAVPANLLLGDAPAATRILYVEDLCAGDPYFVDRLLVPLLAACFFVFVYPWWRRVTESYSVSRQRRLRVALWKDRDETPVHPDAHEQLIESTKRVEKRNRDLASENENLRITHAAQRKELDELKAKNKMLQEGLASQQEARKRAEVKLSGLPKKIVGAIEACRTRPNVPRGAYQSLGQLLGLNADQAQKLMR